MLDLAISIDSDANGTTIAETNHGKALKVPLWPQDSDFNLLAFTRRAKVGEPVSAEALVNDIASALQVLRQSRALKHEPPDWYRRLEKYASGADGF